MPKTAPNAKRRRSEELRRILEDRLTADTLSRIDAALRRLDEGSYGQCFECGDEIGETRLRAVPFAVRCKDCEAIRELAAQRAHTAAERRTVSALLFD